MRGVNKAIIVGALGGDPEVRYLPSGGAVTNISVATTQSWMDKTTGQKQEKTEWHKVCAFGAIAEVMAKYLTKGSKVYIEGQLETKKWQDQSGADRYTTQINCREMQMLGGGSRGSEPVAPPSPSPEPATADSVAEQFDDIPF